MKDRGITPLIRPKPHTNLIINRSNKTKSKIGLMIYNEVKKAPSDAKFIELGGIVELSRKFKISTRTLHKYLPGNIHRDVEGTGTKKLVILHERDITNAREMLRLYDRFKYLDENDQLPLKYLMDFLGRMLPC